MVATVANDFLALMLMLIYYLERRIASATIAWFAIARASGWLFEAVADAS